MKVLKRILSGLMVFAVAIIAAFVICLPVFLSSWFHSDKWYWAYIVYGLGAAYLVGLGNEELNEKINSTEQ